MRKKPYKIIKKESGSSSIYLYGNHHWKELWYAVPEWNKDDEEPIMEEFFDYLGERYFLSQFMKIDKRSPFHNLGKINFHGHLSDSFFSGLLIQYSDCGGAIRVYTYIS